MSHYTAGSSEDWLKLKHHTNKPRAYGFSCGGRDSDWDFADRNSEHYYTSNGPMQLLNNNGGCESDDDEERPCEVFCPYSYQYQSYQDPQPQQQQQTSESDSGSMDVDMEVEMSDTTLAQGPTVMHYAQQQPMQQQQFFQQSPNTVNKRKRTCELEMAAEQFGGVDLSKRMRVGA